MPLPCTGSKTTYCTGWLRHNTPQWSERNSSSSLVTVVRTFGDGFICMVRQLWRISQRSILRDFIYPMHLNPNAYVFIHEVFGEDFTRPNFFFIEPLQYLEFIHPWVKLPSSPLTQEASGGSSGSGKPVPVMRAILPSVLKPSPLVLFIL